MRALQRVNPYLGNYKRLLIPGLAFTVIASGFAVAIPAFVRQSVDTIPRAVSLYSQFHSTEVQSLLFRDLFWGLLLFGLVVAGLSVLSGLFTFLVRQTVLVASRHIEFDMRNALFANLVRLSRDFYHQARTGDLITRNTSDIEQVRRYIGAGLMYITRATVITVVIIITMFSISPTLAFYALLPMPPLAIAIFFQSNALKSRSELLQNQYASLTSHAQESFSSIRAIKTYVRERADAADFDQQSLLYKARMMAVAFVDALFRPLFVLVVAISQIVVVWVGASLVSEGVVTVGNISEYMIYAALLTRPVSDVGLSVSIVQRANASIRRIGEVLDTPSTISDNENTMPLTAPLQGRIRLDNVSFRYGSDHPWVLKNISLVLPGGKTLGIIGRTASGKSTLLEILSRMVDPVEGTVYIDDRDLKTIPLDDYRKAIGYVPQEAFLFSDSIGNNISFGRADASQEEIEIAAEEADLIQNIKDFPQGFRSPVGERGVSLSGGQKQRTAIARVLLLDRKILFFDDAFSNVDTDTEHRILDNLRRRFGKHTLVIVSHRISTVQDADMIVVLERGRITQRGTHQKLVSQAGLYSRLYERQKLEGILRAS